ncbi:hypothetical protein SESBI_10028 [Sesbania bispinosa]|nr:hypothetical protein SESBI_10028 [Sesbania bispinosa]
MSMDNMTAPQQLYYDQGTPGYMPTQPSGYGYQQQFYPGGNRQHVHQNQMQQRNSNQWFRDNQQRPAGALSNILTLALTSNTPENQHLMLHEHLYPVVDCLTPNHQTAKVTETR